MPMDDTLQTTLEHFASHEVYFVRRTGPYGVSAPAAWTDLWDWANTKELSPNVRRAIGFGRDDPRFTPADDLRYDACVVIENGPSADEAGLAGVGRQQIPGGPYVVHRLERPYTFLPPTLVRLHQQTLDSGLETDIRRPFLEIYLSGPDADPPVTDLCIPVLLPDETGALPQ